MKKKKKKRILKNNALAKKSQPKSKKVLKASAKKPKKTEHSSVLAVKASKKTSKKPATTKPRKKIEKPAKPQEKEIVVEKQDKVENAATPVSTPASTSKKDRKKISRKKPGTKSKYYFDDNTQKAIVAFQSEQTYERKNKIYLEEIYPAFDALVENLINVYGFKVMYESRDDLKNECLEFLYGALPKFNIEKGSKAFAYFNIVAKNWLTIKSKQNAKKTQTYISIDNKDVISQRDMETIESYRIAPDGEEIMTGLELHGQVVALIQEISNKVKTENEQNCVKAIKILVDNLEEIDLLNKRAILLYLREITGLSSKQLSIVLASLKKHYKELKKQDEFQF
jgi:hypothetical protein